MIAQEAYDKPLTSTNPVSTSLIPLRECIQAVIDGLIMMRSIQEETGRNAKKKIISIGRQLKKDTLPDEVVLEWAEEWSDLKSTDLDQSKRRDMSRRDWLVQLNRGSSFLYSLLKGLDLAKLKRKS